MKFCYRSDCLTIGRQNFYTQPANGQNHRGVVSKYIYILFICDLYVIILSGRRPPFRADSGRETGVSDTKIWCAGPKANDRKHVCTSPYTEQVGRTRVYRVNNSAPPATRSVVFGIERGRIWRVVFLLVSDITCWPRE